MVRILFPLCAAALLLTPGCKPACSEGFTEADDGSCSRDHFGDPHGTTDGLTGDDTAGGGTAPACALSTTNRATFGTDDNGVDYLEVALTCTDSENDMPGGTVHVLFDTSQNSEHAIVEGTSTTPEYATAYLNGKELFFWLENAPLGDYTATATVFDAAGNIGAPLELTFSGTAE